MNATENKEAGTNQSIWNF